MGSGAPRVRAPHAPRRLPGGHGHVQGGFRPIPMWRRPSPAPPAPQSPITRSWPDRLAPRRPEDRRPFPPVPSRLLRQHHPRSTDQRLQWLCPAGHACRTPAQLSRANNARVLRSARAGALACGGPSVICPGRRSPTTPPATATSSPIRRWQKIRPSERLQHAHLPRALPRRQLLRGRRAPRLYPRALLPRWRQLSRRLSRRNGRQPWEAQLVLVLRSVPRGRVVRRRVRRSHRVRGGPLRQRDGADAR